MNVRICKGDLNGDIDIISSKSDAHRLLIASALSKEKTLIKLNKTSVDINTTIECLNSLGASINQLTDEIIEIEPISINENTDNYIKLNCHESGSTLRFLIPIASALNQKCVFEGEGRLPQRTIKALLDQMRINGCNFDKDDGLPLKLDGQIKGGIFKLAGNISSQFITGLLFALPLLEDDSQIVLLSDLESKPYIDMTIATLKLFNINIKYEDKTFYVKGNQSYVLNQNSKLVSKYNGLPIINVEADWSAAAFWLAIGGFSKKSNIICKGLNKNSAQADKSIIKILSKFGAEININDEQMTFNTKYPKNECLKGIDIDVSQFPDLVPVLAIIAGRANGTTRILNAERLRLKESDRLSVMAECLKLLKVPIKEKHDSLEITGNPRLKAPDKIKVSSHNDHRVAMAMAVAAIVYKTEVTIENAEAVNKSYPDFFDVLKQLGGKCYVE